MALTKTEYEELNKIQGEEDMFSPSMLVDKTDRTLLFGYTTNRASFHVYMKNRKVYINMYMGNEVMLNCEVEEDGFKAFDQFIPSKRVYPESTDAEFLKILKLNDVHIPFTTYNEERYERVKNLEFHGEISEF